MHTAEVVNPTSRRELVQGEGERRRLIVFAKLPRSGAVKTRLVPPLSHDGAAELYRAFLLDSLEQYATLAPAIEPVLYIANGEEIPQVVRMLGGELRTITASRITHAVPEVRPQVGETLGERLEHAFREAFTEGCDFACAIGTDHPTLPTTYIRSAFEGEDADEVVIGPAEDGGYYLIGMSRAHHGLFSDLPYSTGRLFAATIERIHSLGLREVLLPEWYDVDDAGSLDRLLRDLPDHPAAFRTKEVVEGLLSRSSEERVRSNE